MPRSKPKGAGSVHVDQGQLRLLRWLERYPLQRARDLVVALAPWEGRSAVYRRLAVLEDRQLVESVHVGVAGREPLYHVTPVGQYACDIWGSERGQKPRATPLILRDERERLTRMLPRLPVWLVLQDLVNSLVLGATQALANAGTGEPAEMVRWNWLRDYSHSFVPRG